MDNQEGLPAVSKSSTYPDDQTPNRWPTATPSPPEMSWDSDSGGRFSDNSGELAVKEIVDLTLPTPSRYVLIAASHWSMYTWYPQTGASTTNENSAILFSIISLHTS